LHAQENTPLTWDEFKAACPELAALGEERFRAKELCMVGTIRKNGWPRISPCELDFTAGQLFLGMMWESPKARDLLRDPRCVLHSCTSNKDGKEGDFKLYGKAIDVQDEETLQAFESAIKARINWVPPRPYHLFAIDVESAGFIVFGDERYGLAWDADRGLRRWSIG
jgi:Pyridoxamine 5'-phosphate oxidase